MKKVIKLGEISDTMTLSNYWYMYIWIFFVGVFGKFMPQETVKKKNSIYKKWGMTAVLISIIPLIVWAAFRTSTWGDTGAYRTLFYRAPETLSEIPSYMDTVTKDKGFTILVILLKAIQGKTSGFCFFFIAAIQMICLAVVYRKYSCDYWFALFVFIASTDYMSWCHNGVRQFLAVSIIFAASKWIFEKKFIPLILIILLASTIHGSALLMIPIIFIVQGKAANKKTLICIAAALCALFFVGQFTNILDTLLADTQYTNVVTDWTTGKDDGMNPIRVLVYAVPTILAFMGRKYIKTADDDVVNVCTNMSIVSTALSILAMGTSGIFIGRLPIYCSLYANGILLPWEIKNMFEEKSAKIVISMAVVLYSLFFYYQMHYTWGLL